MSGRLPINSKPNPMKVLFQNVFIKMGMILMLIFILLIPASMVQDLIHERTQRQQEAIEEVSSKHAGAQTVTGPILTIPYRVYPNVEVEITDDEKKEEQFYHTEYLHVLPEELNISGKITPERRKRGLFEVVVYGSDLNVQGHFNKLNIENQGVKFENFELNNAFVTIGVSDLKGITDQVQISMADSSAMFNPGLLSSDIVKSGLHVRYPLDTLSERLAFNFDLSLNGSEYLQFTPIGKVTMVDLASPWKEPSFDGNFLPETRKISENGFTANWKVLHLNRNYPQSWTGDTHHVRDSNFGVNLRVPVDVYQKSTRVAKYALLFVSLTFLVFFFVEILNRILIHPIQYILVGLALVLFYILMLAFSEQMYFDYAYLLSAGMTIGLVFIYCRSILKSWSLSAMTAVILSILYGFIFIIIQMQDYALLFGSLGIFLILAVTMFFSRKVDWFDLKKLEDTKEDSII